MEQTTQTQTKTDFDAMTYEEKLDQLREFGIHNHEVRISSTRYGNRTLKCFSEDDARVLALALTEAARDLHGEEWEEHRYGPDTLFELLDNEDRYQKTWWEVTVWCVLPRNPRNENDVVMAPRRSEFIFGHRRGAYRLANPKSKVFVCTGGTDCDRQRWSDVSEYETLLDAHEAVEEQYRWADGPMGWSVITRDEFEQYAGA